MADPTVKMIFAANAAEAERVMVGLEKKVENLEQKLKRTNRTSKETEGMNPFKSAAEGAIAYIGRLATIGTALTALKSQFADIEERQRKAFETQRGVAGALEGMAINIDIPLAEAEAEAKRISKRTGVELGRVMASIGTAFSAKGQLGAKDAFEAVSTTAELVPNLPEAQDLITGATLDIRKFDPRLSSKQAQGFLMRAMVQARVTQLSSMAEHGAPGITGMAMLDRENPQALTEAAGIYGAITQGLRDPHGRKSRTAGTALVIQAREFLGDAAEKMTNREVLETIAQDREAFGAFFKGGDYGGKKRKGLQMTVTGPGGEEISVAADRASFERQAVPVLMSMLTPGTEEYKNWKSATRGMGDLATVEGDWTKKKMELEASSIKQTVDFANRMEADTQGQRASDIASGEWGAVRDKLDAALQSRGIGLMERFTIARELDIAKWRGRDAIESALQAVGTYESASFANSQRMANWDNAAGGDSMFAGQAESYRQENKAYREIIDLLTEANRQREQNKPISRDNQRE